jgi:hypothetical protein
MLTSWRPVELAVQPLDDLVLLFENLEHFARHVFALDVNEAGR